MNRIVQYRARREVIIPAIDKLAASAGHVDDHNVLAEIARAHQCLIHWLTGMIAILCSIVFVLLIAVGYLLYAR